MTAKTTGVMRSTRVAAELCVSHWSEKRKGNDKFSIMTSIDPTKPVIDIVEYAKAADEHGFDTLWIWDTWFSTDAFVQLTLAAMNTQNIKLANCVAATPLRHPSMLVSAISTLDNLSGGRAVGGIGCGGQATVGRLGLRKDRMADFRKYLETMNTLFTGEEIKEDGALYKVDSVRRPAPIYTAAWGPRMLEISAELADGVIIMGADHKEVLKVKINRIKQAAEAAGRDPSEVKIVFGLTCDYADDPKPSSTGSSPWRCTSSNAPVMKTSIRPATVRCSRKCVRRCPGSFTPRGKRPIGTSCPMTSSNSI